MFGLKNKCTAPMQKRVDELHKSVDKWWGSKAIEALSKTNKKSPAVFFKDFYRNVTDLDFDFDPVPDLKVINKFNRKIDQLEKKMKKGAPNKFMEFFYLPEVLMSKNPITKGVFNGFVQAGNYFRGQTEKHSTNLDHIVRNLDLAMKQIDGSNRWGSSVKKADKKIRELERKYQQKLTNNDPFATEFYEEHLARLGEGKNGDVRLKVMQNAYDLFADPSLIKNQSKAINKYGTALVEAASIWHGNMRDDLWGILNRGLKDYVSVIRTVKRKEWGYDGVEKAITDMMDKFKWEENYFPTQLLDIFPALTKFTSGMMDSKSFNPVEGKQTLDTMIEQVSSNLSRPGSTFAKESLTSGRSSHNVIDIIDTYTKNVVRFNYMARTTKNTIEGLKSLQKMEGGEFDSHLNFMKNYLKDTHATATGINSGNTALRSFSRAATSWGFISKLGLNFRSAARNATQSLQNYVWFGAKGVSDAMKYMKSDEMKKMLEESMREEGVFFVNIEELSGANKLFSETIMVDGKVQFKNPSVGSTINSGLEKVAKTLGKPMQWVENKINRQLTFKLSFASEYKRLMENDNIVRQKLKKHIADNTDAEIVMKQVKEEVRKKAQIFARNLTKELHYEYSSFAKAKAVRGPIGSVLGQFTTYSMNFLNYQVQIAKNAKDPFMQGQWKSPEVQRAVRLGMTYFVIQSILQPMFNTTVSNLIQNDTQERLGQLHAWLSGDEDERKKAFFGKGPLISTLGGPFLSDMLNIGNIAGFIDMDKDSFLSYLGAHQDFADLSKDDKVKEFARVLNTQLHRTFYSTIPKFINGASMPTIAGNELALYPDKEQTAVSKKLHDAVTSPLMPDPIKDYFTPSNNKKQTKGTDFWKHAKSNNTDELQALLDQLG
jgi:hypothetical protein